MKGTIGEEGRAVLDSERDRIFGDWLAGHKGILFKVVHAYAFEHADRQDLFQEIVIQIWRSVDAFRGNLPCRRGCTASP